MSPLLVPTVPLPYYLEHTKNQAQGLVLEFTIIMCKQKWPLTASMRSEAGKSTWEPASMCDWTFVQSRISWKGHGFWVYHKQPQPKRWPVYTYSSLINRVSHKGWVEACHIWQKIIWWYKITSWLRSYSNHKNSRQSKENERQWNFV